jgi:hypothetical protein
MYISIRKSAVLPRLILVLLVANCVFLQGCDTEKVAAAADETAEALKRGFTVHDRKAIQAVGKALEAAMHKMNSDPQSIGEVKYIYSNLYDTMMDIDVSACPDDFRAQYHRTLTSVGAFNSALDNVPLEDSDQLLYLLSQIGSSHPDFEGKEMLHDIDQKVQNLLYQASELKAVAHKYDADQDF